MVKDFASVYGDISVKKLTLRALYFVIVLTRVFFDILEISSDVVAADCSFGFFLGTL